MGRTDHPVQPGSGQCCCTYFSVPAVWAKSMKIINISPKLDLKDSAPFFRNAVCTCLFSVSSHVVLPFAASGFSRGCSTWGDVAGFPAEMNLSVFIPRKSRDSFAFDSLFLYNSPLKGHPGNEVSSVNYPRLKSRACGNESGVD